MDAQRIADITAALSDAVGGPVTAVPSGWSFYIGSHIYWIGVGGALNTNGTLFDIPADTLDLLHAASQIVRRMNHA